MNGFFDDQKGSLDHVCEDAHKDDAEECPSHGFSGILLVTLRVVRFAFSLAYISRVPLRYLKLLIKFNYFVAIR